MEEKYGVSFDYAIGTEWTQDIENQIVEAKQLMDMIYL